MRPQSWYGWRLLNNRPPKHWSGTTLLIKWLIHFTLLHTLDWWIHRLWIVPEHLRYPRLVLLLSWRTFSGALKLEALAQKYLGTAVSLLKQWNKPPLIERFEGLTTRSTSAKKAKLLDSALCAWKQSHFTPSFAYCYAALHIGCISGTQVPKLSSAKELAKSA